MSGLPPDIRGSRLRNVTGLPPDIRGSRLRNVTGLPPDIRGSRLRNVTGLPPDIRGSQLRRSRIHRCEMSQGLPPDIRGSAIDCAGCTTLVQMFVLGIDPGLTRCGYGCLDWAGPNRVSAVAAGVVKTPPDAELADRLATIQAEIRSLIAQYKPSVVAIERVLFQVNVQTAMSVGHASGVVMAEAASSGCTVVQYSPNEIKLAVTGWGAADKQQVERMVRAQLKIELELKPVDAADAMAVALCHTAMVGVPPQPAGSPR